MKSIHKTFQQLETAELYKIIALRELVFVVEQNCPYLDCDGQDPDCEHFWFEEDGKICAYVRLVPPSEDKLWSIGRVVTHPDFRGLGLGRKIMSEATQYLDKVKKVQEIKISAQVYLLNFYRELGFTEIGDEYLEDNIPHIKMIWRKH